MSILDLYDSGFRQRNADHFAAIVRVAMEDGEISTEEQDFLYRIARNLDISEKEYKTILKDYLSHPINPPVSFNLESALSFLAPKYGINLSCKSFGNPDIDVISC